MTTPTPLATRDDLAAATFAPIITADQIKIIDGLLCDTEGVVRRRTLLYLLTRSDTELMEIASRDPDKTMDLADMAKEAVEKYEEIAGLMRAAEMRLLAVLARIEAEIEAEVEAEEGGAA